VKARAEEEPCRLEKKIRGERSYSKRAIGKKEKKDYAR
jgi:hypothetical protein